MLYETKFMNSIFKAPRHLISVNNVANLYCDTRYLVLIDVGCTYINNYIKEIQLKINIYSMSIHFYEGLKCRRFILHWIQISNCILHINL